MTLSNSNHSSKTYLYTRPYNYYEDDQSLKSPMITFKFNIKVSFVLDKPDKFVRRSIPDYESKVEFQHHLTDDQLTRDFLSNTFGNTRIIPFTLGNLHWKKRFYDEEWVPLVSTDDVLTSWLDVCHGMVSEYPGRKKLFLIVFIRKEVTVPHDVYLAIIKARKTQEILQQLEYMVRRQAQGRRFLRSEWESMANKIREAGLGNSILDDLNLIWERVIRESREQAMNNRMVPAAERSIQELKKMIYCPGGSKYSEDKRAVKKTIYLVLKLLACLALICSMKTALFYG